MVKIISFSTAALFAGVCYSTAFAQNAGLYTVTQNFPVCESFEGWQQWVKDPSVPPNECYSIPAGTTINVLGVKAGSVAIELVEGPVLGHPTFAIAVERWDYIKPVQ